MRVHQPRSQAARALSCVYGDRAQQRCRTVQLETRAADQLLTRKLEDEITQLKKTSQQGRSDSQVGELTRELLRHKALVEQYETQLLAMQERLDVSEAKLEEREPQSSPGEGQNRQLLDLAAKLRERDELNAKLQAEVQRLQETIQQQQKSPKTDADAKSEMDSLLSLSQQLEEREKEILRLNNEQARTSSLADQLQRQVVELEGRLASAGSKARAVS